MKYYARLNKKTIGPLSLRELVEAGVRPSTYVWTKGMTDWQRAEEDPEICRAMRRWLAGLDPESGISLDRPSATNNADSSSKNQPDQQDPPAHGLAILRGLPEPLDSTQYSRRPSGVSVISAILITIMCFPLTGLVAIWYALRCNSCWKMSQQEGIPADQREQWQRKSHDAARVYRMMIGISFFLGIIMIGLTLSRTLL